MTLRGLLVVLFAAAIGAGIAAGSESYRLHKRQIALAQLIEEGCDSCSLRRAAQLKAREAWRQQLNAADPESDTGDAQ